MIRSRRWSAFVVVGLVALVAGGCGGDDEETAAEGTTATEEATDAAAAEEDAVETAVIAYGEADGPDTCEFVSQEAIDSIGGLERCEREFKEATPTEYDVRDIQVSGDQATVTVQRESQDAPEELKLVNEDGEWKVDPRG